MRSLRKKLSSRGDTGVSTLPLPTRVVARRCLLVLLLLGTLTHFLGLAHPNQVVFDETHMGKFVSSYAGTGKRIFDIHPPHGKLIIAAFARMGGFRGDFSFEKIGQDYGAQPVTWLRLAPAISGVLIPLLFFVLLGYLGASVPAAFLGGLALVLENALLVETRLVLFDGILIASTLAALVCFLAAERSSSRRRARTYTIMCGVFAGLAVGTKITGLAATGIIGVYLLRKIWKHRNWHYTGKRLRQAAVIAAPAIAVYVLGWAIHFSLLDKPGPGDLFHKVTGNFVEDFQTAHYHMLSANLNLAKGHPDASPAWTWPLMKVAPYYWVGEGKVIYLLGNPVIWWGSSILLIVLFGISALKSVTTLRVLSENDRPRTTWIPAVGYFICYLPLFGVKRVLFLYHYLSALTFGLAFAILWLDRAGWTTSSGLAKQRKSYYAVIALMLLGFIAVMPLSYGLSWGRYDEWLTSIVRSWR